MGGDARHRHGRLHADKDQERRHQKSAADAEHAGNEADREPHREHEEYIDGNVGDRKEDLHDEAARRLLRGWTVLLAQCCAAYRQRRIGAQI